MIYCQNCGKGIPDGSKFCTFCGTPVPVVDPEHPNLATAPQHKAIDVSRNYTTTRTINEFYKDPGFWGGLILIIGFFLPFFPHETASIYDRVCATVTEDRIVLLWLVFPLAGLFMMLHSLNILPGFLAIFFMFFALVALIYWGYRMATNSQFYFNSTDATTIIKTVGIGLWATLLGTILLLFHRRHTKVEVNRTKVIDRTL